MAVANGWRVDGADRLIAELTAAAVQVPLVMEAVVDASADALNAAAKSNATGRPGPDDLSGDYRESWSVEEVDGDPTEVARSVGSDHPAAHRLEWGFIGTDAAGRQVDAPPYAHLGPAIDAMAPLYQAGMQQAIDKVLPD